MVVRGQQMHIHSGQPHVVEAVGSYAASLVVTTPTEMEQNSDINLPPPRPTIQVWTGDENQPFIDESLLNQRYVLNTFARISFWKQSPLILCVCGQCWA